MFLFDTLPFDKSRDLYPGDLIWANKTVEKEKIYFDQNAGSFVYYFNGVDKRSAWSKKTIFIFLSNVA